MSKTITVIGSYSVGMFFCGDVLPKPGETVNGTKFFEGHGGKGSNQAFAAALMGADTRFIARVGDDKYGHAAIAAYKQYGVDASLVKIDSNADTSIGAILIDADGRNLINIVPGANGNLSPADIDEILPMVKDSEIVGFQLENKLSTIQYALEKFSALGVKTLLDPAPAVPLPDDLYKHIYYLKPNEHEAYLLSGIQVTEEQSAYTAGRWFLDKGVNTVIITMGEKGSVIMTATESFFVPAAEVDVVDTTGAGDCFSGTMMAALAEGQSIKDAVVLASYSAALAVTKAGVVNALPTREEVEKFIRGEAK